MTVACDFLGVAAEDVLQLPQNHAETIGWVQFHPESVVLKSMWVSYMVTWVKNRKLWGKVPNYCCMRFLGCSCGRCAPIASKPCGNDRAGPISSRKCGAQIYVGFLYGDLGQKSQAVGKSSK